MAGLFKSGKEFPQQIQGTPFWRSKMKLLFRRMDTNCDGLLTIEDFQLQAQRIIKAKGLKGEEADAVKKWRERTFYMFSGPEKHESVSETEMVENSLANFDSEGHRGNIANEMKKWFKAFDLDDDNRISKEEHKNFFQFLMATEEEAEETFAILDKNHDGWLSTDEFLHGFLVFFYSEDPSLPENNFFGRLVNQHAQ